MPSILEISDEELQRTEREQMGRCVCPDCPSFVDGDPSYIYCWPTVGASKFIAEEQG